MIRLTLSAQVITGCDIVLQRPTPSRLLHGKPADQAVRLIPLIYAVCGRAQGQAAALALAAARGIETLPFLEPLVEAEVLREHLWRILLDLPPQLGMTAQHDLFLAAARAIGTNDRASLGMLLGHGFWNELMPELERLSAIYDHHANLLPPFGARQSCEIWRQFDQSFAATPTWQGLPAETGAFARWGGQNPTQASAFAARWQARCAEVWSWAAGEAKVGAGGTASAASPCPGHGRALVETARGLLMHEITLDGETISNYVIVAPTEWNFHPEGVLSEWLRDARFDDENTLRKFVAQATAVLDPCVPWELELQS